MTAQAESAPTSPTLKTSEANAEKLKQELKAAQTNARGWYYAYRSAQRQAAAVLKTAAAGLSVRNDELQRREAEAAGALRDARARLAGQTQAVAQAMTPPAPEAVEFLAASPAPAPAPAPTPAPVAVSPPLGVLRDVRPFRGRPYATLSIGHDAGVRRGMRFGLADPRTGAPAGVVTIDEVGPDEAGGVVEGADPLGLRAGLTIHFTADLAR